MYVALATEHDKGRKMISHKNLLTTVYFSGVINNSTCQVDFQTVIDRFVTRGDLLLITCYYKSFSFFAFIRLIENIMIPIEVFTL
jgi:hypothetical protein